MAEVRTFRAKSMQAALDVVRNELGVDAVILHTRQIAQRTLLPWKKHKEVVEITAGLGVNVRPPQTRHRAPQEMPTMAPVASHSASIPLPQSPVQSKQGDQSGVSAPPSHGSNPPATFRNRLAGTNVGGTPTTTFGASQREALPSRLAAHASQAAGLKAFTSGSSPASDYDPTAAFASKLDSIQSMLENLGRTRQVGRSDEIPGELFHLYTDLIDAEVEDDIARDLVFRLKQVGTHEQQHDADAAKTLLTGMVESDIRCAKPIVPCPGRRKVVALVGPTGVGKTTTIAKLAANLRLRDGVRMGLVTVDTYRIAAVEQLRTYAEIIDLPMKVVTSPLEMRRALDELTGLDLVLIDTAGRSPRDELQIQELKRLLAEADVDEVHLVLSLTASMRSITAAVEKFAAANITALVLTKLDEAAGMGGLLSVSHKTPLPISYLTTGQDVPDDIEPANASRMARLVLGQDRLFD